METDVAEIADSVFRLSTYVPEADLTFNQYLVGGDEPLLFHTGQRMLFPLVSAAVARVLPPESLRWVTFGHVEADECGSMNQWLEVAPAAQVAHGALGCMVQVADLAPQRLALMHGPVFGGDCAAALHALADDADHRLAAQTRA